MAHQCSCGRDLNNNYVSYTNAYANTNSGIDRESSSSIVGGSGIGSKSATSSMSALSVATRSLSSGGKSSCSSPISSGSQTQLTAKVMFGTVGAIKELREKEKSRHAATRASDRRN